jgi:hypothetical protein
VVGASGVDNGNVDHEAVVPEGDDDVGPVVAVACMGGAGLGPGSSTELMHPFAYEINDIVVAAGGLGASFVGEEVPGVVGGVPSAVASVGGCG